MDVSRIEAISPRHIDWRKLTAKEIIKYDNEGIEVPSQYLQWAKEFHADIESAQNDEVTYEMANSGVTASSDTTQPSAESANVDESTAEQPQTEQKTAAQQKREDLQNAGASLRTQTKEFTKDSNIASKEVIQSAVTISDTQESSNDEIQSLEGDMKDLLSKAESVQSELKNEINNINSNKSDKSTFAKIDKLQKQLEKYGVDGQTEVANSESDFNIYKSTINDQSGVLLNATDFGTETAAVGQELLDSIGHNIFRIYDFIVGRRAIQAGDMAVELSEVTTGLQKEADSINDDNLSTAKGYESEVKDVTGVSAADVKKNDKNGTEEQDDSQSQDGSQTAAITETDKAATANLEQVLQAKIRKGEGVNT